MASRGDCCVFEHALPPPCRTIQVSRDEVDPISSSQSFIEATVRAGRLCGCTHLPQDRLLCWELDPSTRCLTVREVIATADQQPDACQWVFTFELLPAVCSYTVGQTVTLVLFSQAGSLLKVAINTSHAKGCLYDPRETTERIQYPLSQVLPGRVTAMEVCNGMLCLACNSVETPLVVLRLDDLGRARPMPLREGKSVSQWISGILGTSQPPCVACMVHVPVTGASDVLAVLYTSGLLSVWEPSSGRHLCQMAVGAAADPQQQVDQLAGVRSTSSTLSVICLSLAHGGRSGTVSLVDTLDMHDVAAVTGTPAARQDLLVAAHRNTASGAEEEFVGQLMCAAVIDSEASLVAVTMHCGTLSRMFVLRVDIHSQDVAVTSAVLSLESSLEESLFTDVSNAAVHEALHEQAALQLASTTNATDNITALHCVLPGLLSASHLNHDALALALMHVGSSVPAAVLHGSSRSALMRTMHSAITGAAQQRGLSPLTVAAQLSQRYLALCTSEAAAVYMLDAPAGSLSGALSTGASDRSQTPVYPSMGALAAPVVIRRGLGVSTLRAVARPGVQMLQCPSPEVGNNKEWHMCALLQAAAAIAGPVMLKWAWGMVPAAEVPLGAACVSVARAVVVGVPSGPFPMSPGIQQAQVQWRERRRKLLLQLQAHAAHIGCIDVLQRLEESLHGLTSGPSQHCAASASHACSAVEAISDLDARYCYTVVFLLHLVLALGSMDGTPLQTHHHARIQALIESFHAQAASVATVRFLSDMWAGKRASEPSLEGLRLSDGSPVDTSSSAAAASAAAVPAAGRRSLLRLLATPSAAELHRTVAGSDATSVVLQLIKHDALWPLEELSRLLAVRAAVGSAAEETPCALFTRGVGMLGALSAAESGPGGGAKVTAVAVGTLCSALDQALLLHAVQSPDTQASGVFQNIVAILYKQLCSMDAPDMLATPALFEVAYFEMLARLCADKMANSAAAAALAQVGLQRANSKQERGRVPLLPQQLRQAAVRMQLCVSSYLCDAGDWEGAYAAVMSNRSAETAENICGLVRRAVGARQLRTLLAWSFPGVIKTAMPQTSDAGMSVEGDDDDTWVHVQPCWQIALEQLKRCAHSRQHSPDLALCKLVYGHCIAAGDTHGAAETMLHYAAHAQERPSSFPDAATAVQAVLTALCFASMALRGVPASNAWVRNVVGAVACRGRWGGAASQPDGLFSPRDEVQRGTQGAELVLTLSDITAECGRLRAVLSVLGATDKGSQGIPTMSAGRALKLGHGAVFGYLLQLKLFVAAAELARSAALQNSALNRALREVATSMGRVCAEAHRESVLGMHAAHAGGASALSWPDLDFALSSMESAEWLQGAHLDDGKKASLEPPGCLRAAAAQAVLACKAGLEPPAFLLVSFMPALQTGVLERNASPRIVCPASAAAILRALIAAGKTKMAVSMVEDYLLEWQRASPLTRQKAGAFWLPWTSVNALLRLLQARGQASNAARLESVLASHAEIVKADSKAVLVDGQRQISAS